LRIDFAKGKVYNVKQVSDLFTKISNPSLSDTEQKDSIIHTLSPFEFCYGQYLLVISFIFKQMDEIRENQKLSNITE
jgi:hypothetical protein